MQAACKMRRFLFYHSEVRVSYEYRIFELYNGIMIQQGFNA